MSIEHHVCIVFSCPLDTVKSSNLLHRTVDNTHTCMHAQLHTTNNILVLCHMHAEHRFIFTLPLKSKIHMYPLNMECGAIGGLITLVSSYLDIEFTLFNRAN